MATSPEATVDARDGAAAKRAKKRLRVRFGIEAPLATGFTTNFSETGLFVQTTNVMRPGTALHLEIHTEEVFPLRAKVVWAKRPPRNRSQAGESGMGLQILDPSPEWVEFCKQCFH